jgi:energy-coupling factor transport system ATP-binding protein
MARYADELVVMHEGRVLLHDETEKVFSKGDLLCSIGLGLPGITPVMQRLRALGMPVREDVFTVEEAVKTLLPLLKGGTDRA